MESGRASTRMCLRKDIEVIVEDDEAQFWIIQTLLGEIERPASMFSGRKKLRKFAWEIRGEYGVG